MQTLKYLTRGNSSPQGKARVYFSAHPEEYKIYLDSVSEDIFQSQNCVIYYDEDANSSLQVEEFGKVLDQMQLFVLPVTERFLFQPNRCRELELPLALKKHIPVLPLLQKTGLEEDFDRICGDLQFLSRQNPDDSGKSYEQKLRTFLTGVLAGDELTEKIRKAFDGIVFLSYRKKDRVYAEKLMKLIHEDQMCRDIAIWYDEFLIPGEQFNHAIQNALTRSPIFVMAVTPNLLKVPNYVMQTEYPEALKKKKEILPAELVETDSEQLRKYYPSIPDSISVKTKCGSKDLQKRIRRIAVLDNKEQPSQLFLMGLAYLNGIDVEVDRRKAFELLVRSANCGYEAAVRKVISMYRLGDGVERNYDAALEWQEKLVKICREQYLKDPEEKKLHALLLEMFLLGRYLLERQKPRNAKAAYEKMELLCLQNLHKVEDRPNLERVLSTVYNKLGDAYMMLEETGSAEIFYEKSQKIREDRNASDSGLKSKRDLAVIYCKRADAALSVGDLTKAEDYYKKCCHLVYSLADESGTVKARRDLALIHQKQGILLTKQERFAEAEYSFRKSMKTREALLAETKEDWAMRELTVSYNMLAQTLLRIYMAKRASGKEKVSEKAELLEAEQLLKQSLEYTKQLAKETKTLQSQRDLAYCYEILGDLRRAASDREEALLLYEKSMEIRKRLSENTEIPLLKEEWKLVWKKCQEL